MKPFVEKLHLDDQTSFYARMHRTPQFEVSWHRHPELELIGFEKGYGTAYIGNAVVPFREGDVFFLGSELPHTFQKDNKDMEVSAMVIQFEESFLGAAFLQIPEARTMQQLFAEARRGLKMHTEFAPAFLSLITQLEQAKGMMSVVGLLQCLDAIAARRQYSSVSSFGMQQVAVSTNERIDAVYRYTIDNYHHEIRLHDLAQIANMTVPAFCAYFKKVTRKTYVQFLNEVRIGHSCKLLSDTGLSVADVCYNSGYNTPANFNKQFLRLMQMRPLQYRSQMRGEYSHKKSPAENIRPGIAN